MTVIGIFQESGSDHFTKNTSTSPDHTFQEIMAWGWLGFPCGPVPVYVPFNTNEIAKISGPTAHLAAAPKSQLLDSISAGSPL